MKTTNWRDECLEEARVIITEFCKEEGIPRGKSIAKRVLAFAKDPFQITDRPLTEFELFVSVDALGDFEDDEIVILFQFLRWCWWSRTIAAAPRGADFNRPHAVEELGFNRYRLTILDKVTPSEN